MRLRRLAIGLALIASPAVAGPPFITDDPVPTDLRHWEIYAFTTGEGIGQTLDDETGFDLNYGAAKDVQLTATLPLALSHEQDSGWRAGTDDAELAVKYRFVNDERRGFSAAVFPRAILPTSSNSHGEKTRLLLPVWAEEDLPGGTSLFGGGGYEINPGAGNRDFWQAGLAVTHQVTKKLLIGGELAHQGADVVGGTGETSAGLGSIVRVGGDYSLLLSAGPTWSKRQTSYHFYAALGMNF